MQLQPRPYVIMNLHVHSKEYHLAASNNEHDFRLGHASAQSWRSCAASERSGLIEGSLLRYDTWEVRFGAEHLEAVL